MPKAPKQPRQVYLRLDSTIGAWLEKLSAQFGVSVPTLAARIIEDAHAARWTYAKHIERISGE